MIGRIILCADDYGLSPGISQAIRMLIAANRISATSALVTRTGWMQDAAALKPLWNDTAVGLHLNLTLGAPLSRDWCLTSRCGFPGIRRLIAAAYTGRLKSSAVTAEIECQLDQFESGLGAPPDFIDGHEHVHILPVVRPALLGILKRRYAGRPLLIRDPSPTAIKAGAGAAPRFKILTLKLLARNMKRDVAQTGFITNDCFGGVTDFGASAVAVADDFSAAAELQGWRPLVMCHPGYPDADLARLDPVTARRQFEYDALMGASPLSHMIWHPARSPAGVIQWPTSAMERAI